MELYLLALFVQLTDNYIGVPLGAGTDRDGRIVFYAFRVLPGGFYILSFYAVGFLTVSMTRTLVAKAKELG